MVSFTCNTCGNTVKKAQVDFHYKVQCKRCESLSCIDCGKDFWGDDYKQHIKCMTEDEKYSGPNYKAKANKGEVKQDQWTEQVYRALDKAELDDKLRIYALRLREFSNVPRKKVKFDNMMRNSLKVRDASVWAKLWALISAEKSGSGTADEKSEKTEDEKSEESERLKNNEEEQSGEEKSIKEERKKLKALRKAERKKVKTTAAQTTENKENGREKKERKQKRKHQDIADNEEAVNVEESEGKKREKKRQKTSHNGDDGIENNNRDVQHEERDDSKTAPSGKFNWEAAIKSVIEKAKGEEVTFKRLRKKVLAEYYSQSMDSMAVERLEAKLVKKLKNPAFSVSKNKVKLKAV